MEPQKKFVIQKHTKQDQPVHWDLMLEKGDCLETFRLGVAPSEFLNRAAAIEKIADHPLRFLNYEGPVNKGLGNVQITDKGDYEPLTETEEKRELRLNGGILRGQFYLSHIKENLWEFGPCQKNSKAD